MVAVGRGEQVSVSAVGARLAAPGIGTDAGGVPGTTMRNLFQGRLFNHQTKFS
jgi:cystathionine beta-lyase family protein involved in aluminum resistance